MFDALEKRFLRDKDRQQQMQGDLINELYQGTWEDYVKCKGVSSDNPLSLCYYLPSLQCSAVLLALERTHSLIFHWLLDRSVRTMLTRVW